MPKFTREQFRNALETAEMQAFLRVIRTGEGTLGDDGYRTIFGGELFDDFSDHPRRLVTKRLRNGKRISSTAAGVGQFLERTWDWMRRLYAFEDFTPARQLECMVALIAHRGALVDVLAGRFDDAVRKCAREWASLPGSPYGQPTLTLARARKIYQTALAGGPEERTARASLPVQGETNVSPFVAVAAGKIIEMVPDLFRLFGGKNAERNAELAEHVVQVAQDVTGEDSAEKAVAKLEDDPELQAQLREEFYAQRLELEKFAHEQTKEARKFVRDYREGERSLGNFTFPELLSILFGFGGYLLGVCVIFFTTLATELKAAVVTALVVQAVNDIRGFWFGSSVQQMKKEVQDERRRE